MKTMSGDWLEQIYEEKKQELFRFLYVILGDKQAAEDALQETFLKAYLHRSKYVEMQKEKSWLYKIARNTAYDIIRKRHREFPIEKDQIEDWSKNVSKKFEYPKFCISSLDKMDSFTS